MLAAALAAVAVGCGSSEDENEPLAPADAVTLTRLIADAREAGAQDDREGTLAALREFRDEVTELERRGRIDPLDADALRKGARQAQGRVSADVKTPPLTPAPEPPPEEVAPPAEQKPDEKDEEKKDKDEEKREGFGEEKGEGKGEDG